MLLLALTFSLDIMIAQRSDCLSPVRAKKVSVQEGRGTGSNRLGTHSFHRVAVTHGSALSQLRSLLICSAHQLNLGRPSTSVGGRQEVTSAGPGGGVTDCGNSLFDSHLTPQTPPCTCQDETYLKPRPPLRSETPASSFHTGTHSSEHSDST